MSSHSRQQPRLLDYLLDNEFWPQDEGKWFDRAVGGRIIRVVCDDEDDSRVIVLTPRGVCLYKATFTLSVPNEVIIATVEAALAQSHPEDSGSLQHARRRATSRTANQAAFPAGRTVPSDDDR